MDFIYLFRVLTKKKWIIIGAGIMAAFIAYVLTNNLPKKYRSSAQVSTGFTMPDETRPGENFNFAESDTKFNNVIVTFSSPTVVSLLSYKLMLHDLGSADAFRGLTKKDQESPFYKSLNIEQAKQIYQSKLDNMTMLTSYKPDEKKLLELLNLYEYDYKSLIKKLTIYQLQHTDFLQIDFTSENPELSAFVVNTIYDQFLRYYGSVRSAKSRESIDTLKSILDKKKQVLDQKNALLRDKGVMTANDNNSSNIELINSYNKEIADEENNKTEKTYSLQKINQRLSLLSDKPSVTSSSNINNNDEIVTARNAANQAYAAYLNNTSDKSLYDKYFNLKKEYEDKVRQYGSSNIAKPETKTGEDKFDLTNKKTDYELDIQASNEKIKGLKAKVAALRREILGSMTKDATVESLLKEEEQANKEYLDAKQRYNDAIDANTASVSNFKLVVPGQPAIEPDPSYRGLIVGLAGVAAFITTILIIIFLTYLDSSIKTPSIFSRSVGLKLISMVNFMNLRNKTLADIIS
ncbi:MAG TPA: Wzz/FepE/Etk N-terminal domain-containing protein, partial [Flavisolibacter sp.]|nr:Wzz/FepE/Etk N-terminal domain-containing protein [Flavisolibacter sp.]